MIESPNDVTRMNHRLRTILFIVLLLAFVTVGPLAVLYSVGWRFDWEQKRFVQWGALYIKAWPKSVNIVLDGKSGKRTDFFFGAAFIEDLHSKDYAVELHKEGYHAWKKELKVNERQVTELKYTILFPRDPGFSSLSKNLEAFFVAPSEKKLVLKETVSPLFPETAPKRSSTWALKLYNLEKEVKSTLVEERDIAELTKFPLADVDLRDATFSPDGKQLVLEVGIAEDIHYYQLDIDAFPATLQPLEGLEPNPETLYFNPRDPDRLFFLSKGTLYEQYAFVEQTLIPTAAQVVQRVTPRLTDLITCSLDYTTLYCLNQEGFVIKTTLSFGTPEKLTNAPLDIIPETEYTIYAAHDFLFVQESATLYQVHLREGRFEELFEGVSHAVFSPDTRKLLFVRNNELAVRYLVKHLEQPHKMAGDTVLLAVPTDPITELFWLNNMYVVFAAGDTIRIAELDDRGGVNVVSLATFTEPTLYWDARHKQLLVASEEALYVSEKLAP